LSQFIRGLFAPVVEPVSLVKKVAIKSSAAALGAIQEWSHDMETFRKTVYGKIQTEKMSQPEKTALALGYGIGSMIAAAAVTSPHVSPTWKTIFITALVAPPALGTAMHWFSQNGPRATATESQ